jgi:small conductance mechanosensitive channel
MTNLALNLDTLQHAKQKIVDLSIEFGPRALTALLIMIIGFFVARWISRGVESWLGKLQLEPPIRQLLLRGLRLLVLGLFLILALQNLGVQLLPLIAGLGVAGAGIALAMQGVLGNLVAGFTIIFTKPFRVGEYVSMIGVEGRVENIELFSTTLSHADRSRVVVPNRKIVGEILHNYGNIRQLNLAVSVAYGTDLNAALAAVNFVLGQNRRVVKDLPPIVGVSVLEDSSIRIAIKPWVNVPDFGPASAEVNQAVVEEFRARNIKIPLPQHEVRLLNAAA